MPVNISLIEHPLYTAQTSNWQTYRLVGNGGEAFLQEYLISRPKEAIEDFLKRKKLSYIPTVAKSALNQIRNSIRQRLTAVERVGGSANYTRATKGLDSGVDKKKSSMNKFIGDIVLSELTMMGAVGIYVDAPRTNSPSLEIDEKHVPYLQVYKVEDIKSWATHPDDPTMYTKLLLREYAPIFDKDYGLIIDFEERYRLFSKTDTGVILTYFNAKSQPYAFMELALDEIPFVHLQLSDSLISDVSRHQISLLNLGSADVKYIWEGNVVFLAEKYDPNSPEAYWRQTAPDPDDDTIGSEETQLAASGKRFIGTDKGVRVPQNLDYPQYISPDSAPLDASMKKQKALEEQTFELINQSLKSVSSRSSSAESKQVDVRREEDGLKAIGDELECGENKIAYLWAKYEGKKPAQVKYPSNYEFKSDDARRTEAKELSELVDTTPSKTAQKEISKKIAKTILEDCITEEKLNDIYLEIDKAAGVITSPDTLQKLVESTVLSPGTAAVQLGFDESEAEKAFEAKVRVAEEIAKRQSNAAEGMKNPSARGLSDLSSQPKLDAESEKK